MKAKNREHYIASWNSAINEFIHPFLDAERPMEDWVRMKGELRKVVGEAAEKIFPEEVAA